MTWRPLSWRTAGKRVDDTLYEGVPNHLRGPLRAWVPANTTEHERHRAAARLRWPEGWTAEYVLDASTDSFDTHKLDLVDALLYLRRQRITEAAQRIQGYPGPSQQLRRLFADAGSAWRVNTAGDGLERRLAPSVTQAVELAVENANESAADHLGLAISAAYGRHPDSAKAYSEAVKAVEAAGIPIVLPQDAMATLGKVLGHLRSFPDKWQLAIPGPADYGDVAPLIEMLDLLWTGQTDRHGGNEPTKHVQQEAAEMAVHLAATLVQWFGVGAVRRRS